VNDNISILSIISYLDVLLLYIRNFLPSLSSISSVVDILGDEHKCVVIYNAQSKLFIWRVLDKSYLVVVLQKNVLPDKYRLAINEAIFVLQKSMSLSLFIKMYFLC